MRHPHEKQSLITAYGIPEDAQHFASQKANLYGYIYERDGKPYAVTFTKNSKKKHFTCNRYKDETQRANHIDRLISRRIIREAEKEEWKQDRNKPATLKAGGVLYTCWGYDQTNTEFYKVLEVRGKRKVVLTQLALDDFEPDSGMSAKIYPDVLKHVGEPFERMAQHGDRVRIHNSATAYPWDGAFKNKSWTH